MCYLPESSSEDLRCPLQNCSDVYNAFVSNVEEFREPDCLPVNVNFGNQGTAESFMHNKASWHKQFHQKFNCSMLHHSQLKRKTEMEGTGCTSRPIVRCAKWYLASMATRSPSVNFTERSVSFISAAITFTDLSALKVVNS